MIGRVLRGPLLGRLGFRLMAAVGLALLPLAVLSYVQAERVDHEATARAEAALIGETLRAAAPQTDAIRRIQGGAAALAVSIVPVVDDVARCTAVMQAYARDEPLLSLAGFVQTDGMMNCSSTGVPFDFSAYPQVASFVADPRPMVVVNPNGPVSGESVLGILHPVRGADGALLGFIATSMPHRALQPQPFRTAEVTATDRPLALATFDRDGTVLTAMNGIDTVTQRLPADRTLADLAAAAPTVFQSRTPDGQQRSFAVIALFDQDIFVLSSWPVARGMVSAFGTMLPLWAIPLVMWLASLIVAWIATEHQVLRHIRALRQSIVAFAAGGRSLDPPDLTGAAVELRDVGDAYERMVDRVMHDEAELENGVHQKEVLLREVHHRVKNNLQLIASIMNIQMRKAFSPEAKTLVKGLHDRILSLATVHRELYQTSGLTDIKADELLSTIVAQVVRMGVAPGHPVERSIDIDPIRLTPDQAVPLSLILTEALTNVLKHAITGPETRLTVTMKRLPEGRAHLLVANSLPEDVEQRTIPPSVDSTGLGEQLMTAFASQLGGQIAFSRGPDEFSVAVVFGVRALAEGEERFGLGAPAAPPP